MVTKSQSNQQFGKYQLLEMLGKGAFALVYKALDTTLQRVVALKILHPNLLHDRNFVFNFAREAKIAANLTGDHLITIYEVGEVKGYYYLAMQYMPGGTLAKRLSSGQHLAQLEAFDITSQVAKALKIVHDAGLVHRDIKPSNILFDDHGQAYLSDFGIARAADNSTTMTASHRSSGTAAYISPELAKGEAADHRSDIYTLGIVAYEMLTGRPPFVSKTPYGYIHQHADEPPPPPAQFNTEISQAVQDVLLRALEKDPNRRYQSVENFATALRDSSSRPFHPASTQTISKEPVQPTRDTTMSNVATGPIQPSPVYSAGKPIPRRMVHKKENRQNRATWLRVAILGFLLVTCALVSGIYVTLNWNDLSGLAFRPTETHPVVALATHPDGESTAPIDQETTPAFVPQLTETVTLTQKPSDRPASTATPTAPATATNTPIPTSTPTLVPTPISISNLPVIFQDDFSNPTHGWRLICSEYCFGSEVKVENGELVVLTEEHAALGGTPDLTFDNFILEVDSRWSGGAIGGEYGVIFRKSEGKPLYYYAIFIGNDGRYYIGKANGTDSYDWDVLITGFSETINRDGGINRFHIEAKDHEIGFFINEIFIATLHDVDFDIGSLILAVRQPSNLSFEASFDNLIVTIHPEQP